MSRPVGIDLFAGAGGLSLGFERAGFDVVAAVEIDPIHAAVHKYNFPRCISIPRSVIGLTGKELRHLSGIRNKRVDVVFGGAPCQGFSLIGHRVLDDPRNQLVREFIRIVKELDATYFVFENVKGLTVGKHRMFLEEFINEFHQLGYTVRLPWQVLNAKDYGVPQNRQRLFIYGSKNGYSLPNYPTPVRNAPTCKDALDDLPDIDDFEELLNTDEVKVKKWKKTSNYAASLRCEAEPDWSFGYKRIWDPHLLTSSMRTIHTEISKRRFNDTPTGEVEPISRFFKLDPNGVSNTLRAGTDSARGAFTSPRPIHYKRNRCISVREMARLHGYPDWFRFNETKWHGAREVGNSVPPPLAEAVAKMIIQALDTKVEQPQQEISLGDPALLRMGMTEAARYFGIDIPIGKRNGKSGMTKRKQSEIIG